MNTTTIENHETSIEATPTTIHVNELKKLTNQPFESWPKWAKGGYFEIRVTSEGISGEEANKISKAFFKKREKEIYKLESQKIQTNPTLEAKYRLEELVKEVTNEENNSLSNPIEKLEENPFWRELELEIHKLTKNREKHLHGEFREKYVAKVDGLKQLLKAYFARNIGSDGGLNAKNNCIHLLNSLDKVGGSKGEINDKDFEVLLDVLSKKDKQTDVIVATTQFDNLMSKIGVDARNPNENFLIPSKQEIIKGYLIGFAKSQIVEGKVLNGGKALFYSKAETVLNSMVGAGHLTKSDFEEAWKMIEEDENVKKLISEGKGGEKAEEAFGKLMDKEEEKIEARYDKAKQKSDELLRKMKSNPNGYKLREFGDLAGISLYLGKEILYGIILTNLALAGFNPLELIQNPVAWATVGGVFGITKYYNPDFMKDDTENEKATKENIIQNLKNETSSNPAIKENLKWITQTTFSDDLANHTYLGKILSERKRWDKETKSWVETNEITTADIVKAKEGDKDSVKPTNEIKAGSDEAKKLFSLLLACKQNEINPKKILDE